MTSFQNKNESEQFKKMVCVAKLIFILELFLLFVKGMFVTSMIKLGLFNSKDSVYISSFCYNRLHNEQPSKQSN